MSLTTTISTMRWTASVADALWCSYALQFSLQLRIARYLWHQNAPPCTNPAKQEAMPSKAWLPALSRVQGGNTCAGCKGKPLAVNEAEGRLAQQMLAFAERSLGKLCFSRPRSPEAKPFAHGTLPDSAGRQKVSYWVVTLSQKVPCPRHPVPQTKPITPPKKD